MRFIGLTLCLLASSLGARAESVEDRVAALEARVKALEEALHGEGPKAAVAKIDGTYQGAKPNGQLITLQLLEGTVTAVSGQETTTGTYEIAGQRVIVTAGGKSETLTIDGNVLHDTTSGNAKIDFYKKK